MRDRMLACVSAALLALAAPAAGQTWMPGPSFPEAPQPRLQGAAVVYHGLIYVLGGSPFDATVNRNGITDYFDGTSLVQGPVLDGPFISQGAGVDSPRTCVGKRRMGGLFGSLALLSRPAREFRVDDRQSGPHLLDRGRSG